ncbi:hypothetical protein ACP4OV_015059 [Aristida adscensionis]
MKEGEGVNQYYIMFLTVAFVCALVGLAAGTFYKSFPWAKVFAGLGAWQSFLFVLALYHIEIKQYYKLQDDALTSWFVSMLVVTTLWAFGVQDPMFLHSIGKLGVVVVYGFGGREVISGVRSSQRSVVLLGQEIFFEDEILGSLD